MDELVAPFPWFGGKSYAAPMVADLLRGATSYVEPFCGSLAVLLASPARRVETVNDADGLLVNAWRAMRADPEGLAAVCDWPVSEADLSARHLWLVGRRAEISARVQTDTEWYDRKAAGWWIWGACSWIGSGWCSGDGPWTADPETGAWVGGAGRGINRQLPHLGDAGKGINRLTHDGRRAFLVSWFGKLAARLSRVRIACGDWSRVVTPAVVDPLRDGLGGVFLDPPYSEGWDTEGAYAGGGDCFAAVAEWATTAPESWRIVVAGYSTMWATPPGWTVHAINSRGGYQKGARSGTEVLWASPACGSQPSLFAQDFSFATPTISGEEKRQ